MINYMIIVYKYKTIINKYRLKINKINRFIINCKNNNKKIK